jgi:hypothetical protein
VHVLVGFVDAPALGAHQRGDGEDQRARRQVGPDEVARTFDLVTGEGMLQRALAVARLGVPEARP